MPDRVLEELETLHEALGYRISGPEGELGSKFLDRLEIAWDDVLGIKREPEIHDLMEVAALVFGERSRKGASTDQRSGSSRY